MVAAKNEKIRMISERMFVGTPGRRVSIRRCLKNSSEMIKKKGGEEAITPPQDSSAIRMRLRQRNSVLFDSSSETPTPRAYNSTLPVRATLGLIREERKVMMRRAAASQLGIVLSE